MTEIVRRLLHQARHGTDAQRADVCPFARDEVETLTLAANHIRTLEARVKELEGHLMLTEKHATNRIMELEARERWVSVSERLPEHSRQVAIHNPAWMDEKYPWDHGWYKDGQWESIWIDDPTHWREIQPPGSEGEGS